MSAATVWTNPRLSTLLPGKAVPGHTGPRHRAPADEASGPHGAAVLGARVQSTPAATVWTNPRLLALPHATHLRVAAAPAPLSEARMNDRQLVDHCLSGDAAAWEDVVRQHSRRVYNLCFRFTGSATDAEDLSQEVFIRLFRNLANYRAEVGSLSTWLTTLTRNLLIDHYRRSKSDRLTGPLETENAAGDPVPLALTAPGRSADHQVWGREVQEHVQRALLKLSPELRETIILRDLQDLDYKEIATVLRLPEGTVKSRINRARIELARLLRPSLGIMESKA
ncbi:MAG: RNA polymerase sigma factor [Terriglobales bacterium]